MRQSLRAGSRPHRRARAGRSERPRHRHRDLIHDVAGLERGFLQAFIICEMSDFRRFVVADNGTERGGAITYG